MGITDKVKNSLFSRTRPFVQNHFESSHDGKRLAALKDKYKGKNTYIYKTKNSYSYKGYEWEQADILTAELYCDAHCKNGDIDNFSSDKDSVMFIDNELYEANRTKMSAFSVISQNSDYKVLYNGI